MKYYIDTEFYEHGHRYPVELISLGIVSEKNEKLYIVNSEFNWNNVPRDEWIYHNVKPHLAFDGKTPYRNRYDMRSDVIRFIGDDPKPEFWGYFADYDWVVFCQLFGSMLGLPSKFPQFCRDTKQLAVELGNPILPAQDSTEHNALNDAIWTKNSHEYLLQLEPMVRKIVNEVKLKPLDENVAPEPVTLVL